jgi:hypothetical protein
MRILQQCINDDKRTTFHALTYAAQAIQYYNAYNDETALSYLKNAQKWLNKEGAVNKWDKINIALSLENIRKLLEMV